MSPFTIPLDAEADTSAALLSKLKRTIDSDTEDEQDLNEEYRTENMLRKRKSRQLASLDAGESYDMVARDRSDSKSAAHLAKVNVPSPIK